MAVVRKTKQANEDLYQIWYYIAVEHGNPRNAERFIDLLDQAMVDLSKSPNLGTSKEEYIKGIRQFVFQKYLILYFVLEDGIEVVRVLHSARDILNVLSVQ